MLLTKIYTRYLVPIQVVRITLVFNRSTFIHLVCNSIRYVQAGNLYNKPVACSERRALISIAYCGNVRLSVPRTSTEAVAQRINVDEGGGYFRVVSGLTR